MRIGYQASRQRDYQTALINFRRALNERPGDAMANRAAQNMEAAIENQSNGASVRRDAVLVSQEPGSRINVRDGASPSSFARHYGFAGDRVWVVGQTSGDDGKIWYRVQFRNSGATGWIREDFVSF
jgi:hypothetical protein